MLTPASTWAKMFFMRVLWESSSLVGTANLPWNGQEQRFWGVNSRVRGIGSVQPQGRRTPAFALFHTPPDMMSAILRIDAIREQAFPSSGPTVFVSKLFII